MIRIIGNNILAYIKVQAGRFSFFWIGLLAVAMSACSSDSNSPGVEYMPDMYRSPSYETYGLNRLFADSMQARLPVAGTVPRGYMPYNYPNTNEGYEMAGDSLKNPLPLNSETVAEGETLYVKFCLHCHGAEGMGDGKVVTVGGFPPPRAFSASQLIDLPEGKMFHSITYGKNLMGAHASQLTQDERWKIIYYINVLQYPDETAQESDSVNVENNK